MKQWLRAALRSLKDEHGIGMAESVVAIGLLGVGVVALVSALSAGSIAVKEQSQEVVAQQLAQAQIEAIKAAPYDVTGASYTTVSAPAGYSVAFTINSTVYATTNIQKITVTVSRSGSPVLTVESYKVNR